MSHKFPGLSSYAIFSLKLNHKNLKVLNKLFIFQTNFRLVSRITFIIKNFSSDALTWSSGSFNLLLVKLEISDLDLDPAQHEQGLKSFHSKEKVRRRRFIATRRRDWLKPNHSFSVFTLFQDFLEIYFFLEDVEKLSGRYFFILVFSEVITGER